MAPQNESMPSKDTTGEPDKNVSGEGQKLKEGLALGATDSSRSSTNASIGELEAMPLKGNAAEVDKITSGGEEEVKEGDTETVGILVKLIPETHRDTDKDAGNNMEVCGCKFFKVTTKRVVTSVLPGTFTRTAASKIEEEPFVKVSRSTVEEHKRRNEIVKGLIGDGEEGWFVL